MFDLNLQKKTILISAVMIFIFTSTAIFVLRNFILSSFYDLENRESVKSVERSKVVFDQQLVNLDIKLTDWAIWDDTYKFINDKNPEYVKSNLNDESLHNLGVDGMLFVDLTGKIIYEKQIDSDSGEELFVLESLKDSLLNSEGIVSHSYKDDKVSGVIKDSSGMFLLASRPILRSDGSGPKAGTLIFVKKYDDVLANYFKKVNNNNGIKILDYDAVNATEAPGLIKEKLLDENYYSSPLSDDYVAGYTVIYDLNNNPSYILQITRPREIYKQGINSINNFFYYLIFVFVAGVTAVLFVINKLVLSKIINLNKSINRVRDTEYPDDRVEVNGNDEFADLAKNINKMLDEISKSQEDLFKFKLAIENSSEHVVITDPEGKILYANHGAEILTGFSREEMIGNNPKLWGRQMPKEFYVKMWDTIKNKKLPFSGELINKKKNGQTYNVYSNITPILDENKNVKFYVAIERDITHEKREKEIVEKQVIERTKELRYEKIKLASSISSLSMGIVMTDMENNIVLINQSSRDLLGIKSASPLSIPIVKTINEIDSFLNGSIDLTKFVNQVKQEGKPVHLKDIEFNNRFLKIYISPIRELALIIGTIILIDDISEAKIIEKSKDEFFSIASHELRTPLTVIRGNSALIKEHYSEKIKSDHDLEEMINDIHDSSVRLIQIVNDFLNVSRLEQGRMEFKKERLDLSLIIQEVIKEVGALAIQSSLYLKFEPKVNLPNALGDRAKAKEIIINLISNAIKYTDKGGVNVDLLQNGNMLEIRVADTGRGISLPNQKLLFRKFQQAGDNALTHDTSKSTGLGLYISKLMTEGMGGKIELINSQEGKGSVFSLSLPLA